MEDSTMKMATVQWHDPDTTDTSKLACQAYGIRLLADEPSGEADTHWICVYGPTESVNTFLEDVSEDSIEPFESKRELSDNEYQEWLADSLKDFGCLYIPAYSDEDSEEEADA